MRKVEREISNKHEDYSKCMADIQEFKNKNGDKATEMFLQGMEKNDRDGTIKRINACRSFTKEWWRSVISFSDEFHAFDNDPRKRELYRGRYRRFVPLVKPLDGLPSYDGVDPVFEFEGLGSKAQSKKE